MDAKSEQRSLAECPLPVALPPAVNPARCPSYIAELDRDIREHTEIIEKLREARQTALQYAIANNILEDEAFQVVKKEKNLPRRINADLLKEKYPDIHEKAVEIEKANAMEKAQALIDKVDEAGKDIRLKTLDVLMSKAQIDEVCWPHEISVSWEIKTLKAKQKLPETTE